MNKNDFWATQTLAKILWAGILLWRPGVGAESAANNTDTATATSTTTTSTTTTTTTTTTTIHTTATTTSTTNNTNNKDTTNNITINDNTYNTIIHIDINSAPRGGGWGVGAVFGLPKLQTQQKVGGQVVHA